MKKQILDLYSLIARNEQRFDIMLDAPTSAHNVFVDPLFDDDMRDAGISQTAVKHPENFNVEAKIRQQLQFLRNRGFIKFLGKGKYKKL